MRMRFAMKIFRLKAFIYSGGSGVKWQTSINLKNQAVFDTLTVCDATIDLSIATIDLTRKSITAQARWLTELVTELTDQIKEKMKRSVLKVNGSKELLTKDKQKKTVF